MEDDDSTLFPYCCPLNFSKYDYDSSDSEDGLCIPRDPSKPIIMLPSLKPRSIPKSKSKSKSKSKPNSKSTSSSSSSKKRLRTLFNSSSDLRPSKHVKRFEFDVTKLDTIKSQGTKITVVELLNTFSIGIGGGYFVDKNGDKVRYCDVEFEGKYVLILMLDGLPIENLSEDGKLCWALKNACSSWPNFQLLIVAGFNNNNDNNEEEEEEEASDYLKTFLRAFPCSCLGIPLSVHPTIEGLLPEAFVVNPDGSVLNFECSALVEFGTEYFPFTSKHLDKIESTSYKLCRRRPVPLEKLLGLDPSSRLYNIQNTHFITVSDLKEKLVGLYLIRNGYILNYIDRIYDECQAKNRELMIVLVYNSVSDDPQHFQDAVNGYLRDKGISSWWVLPFNDSTSRRLWRLCKCPEDGLGAYEQFIMVGPQGQFLEPMASKAITCSCFDDHDDLYPYAFEALAQEETARLRSLTLESLLLFKTKTHGFLVTPTGERVHMKRALRGKKVILCLVDFVDSPSDLQEELRDWCRDNEFFGHHDGTVLVVVPFKKKSRKIRKLVFTDSSPDTSMPWLICPPDPLRKENILKEIALKGLGSEQFSYIAFGEDGRISFATSHLSEFWSRKANAFLPYNIYNCVLDAYKQGFNIS